MAFLTISKSRKDSRDSLSPIPPSLNTTTSLKLNLSSLLLQTLQDTTSQSSFERRPPLCASDTIAALLSTGYSRTVYRATLLARIRRFNTVSRREASGWKTPRELRPSRGRLSRCAAGTIKLKSHCAAARGAAINDVLLLSFGETAAESYQARPWRPRALLSPRAFKLCNLDPSL